MKHEYFDGMVYAMAGARNAHNRITTNALVAVGKRLVGRPCQPFNSDTKIRIQQPRQVRFYYPRAAGHPQQSEWKPATRTAGRPDS